MATGRLPDPNTAPLTAKGDLYTYSTVPARLAVGSNGETLVADSSATTGLRYQTGVNNNAVINGGFDVWQRGTSFTGSLGNVYGADRWLINPTTERTFSRQTASLDGFQYSIRMARNSGSTDTGGLFLVYSMESTDSYRFAGKTVTLSFWAKAGANFSSSGSALTINWQTGTGTDQNIYTAGYTGSATVANTTRTITTSWARYSVTGTLASSATETGFWFTYTPTGTAGANDWVEITGVQMELGSVATEFKRAGNTLAGELAACQRYYQVANRNDVFAQGGQYSATAASAPITFITEMRGTPTITLATVGTTSGTINFLTGGGNYPTTTGTIAAISITRFGFLASGTGYTASFSTGVASGLYANGATNVYTASAEL